MNLQLFRSSLKVCMMLLLVAFGSAAHADTVAVTSAETSPASAAIPDADLLQPAELAQTLRTPSAVKPLILQVGSRVLFTEAHVSGAEYVGAAGQEAGLQALATRVKSVRHDQALVIYCGCCPWSKCPNIRPAYEQLRKLGFTQVKVLYLADNFGTDWVDKGYPIAKGN